MRPAEELQKLKLAIENARIEWRERDELGIAPKRSEPSTETGYDDRTSSTAPIQDRAEPTTSVPYREASFGVNPVGELHEVPQSRLVEYVVKVVETEGPVHIDEIASRIRSLWGLQRTGSRIQKAISQAASIAVRKGLIVGTEFFALPGQPIVARNRAWVNSPTLRKPEYLPPEEVDAALVQVVSDNFGASADEIAVSAARVLGFQSTSAQLRSIIDKQVSALTTRGKLAYRNELYVLNE